MSLDRDAEAWIDPVAAQVRRTPDKRATCDLARGATLTYGELNRRIAQYGAYLIKRFGAESGVRVAMLARNGADTLVAQFGCVRAGAIFVPMNWRLAPAELIALAADCSPRLVLHDAEFAGAAKAVAESCNAEAVAMGEPFEALLAGVEPAPPTALDPDAPATLLYTSGTTGKPKGVIVTERNARATAENFVALAHVSAESVFLCEPPLFHVVGLYAICRSTLTVGGTLLFSDRFDPARSLAWLTDAKLGVTHYMCVPQMAQALRGAPGFDGRQLAHLETFSTGGSPHPKAMILPWLEEGVALADGYGMSEAGTVLGMPARERDALRVKAGSAGLAARSVETRITRADGGEAGVDEIGELWVKGPNVSPGYWNNPEATAASRVGDWLRTGDLARRDGDGFFFLVDRAKDLFITGGENVYPAEVESVVLELPGVAEVAVFGAPDARWGEIGCAVIVTVSGARLDADEVISHCRARLAGYKIPKHIAFASSLPRTASGKVQKHTLRGEWLARTTAEKA